jgi:hypothetical protein
LPLPSMGRRLQSTLAFGIEGPFLFSQRSTYKASIYFNRCNILRPTLSGNAMSSDRAVPRLECL